MKDAGNRVQRHAIDYNGARHVDHGNLRLRRGAMRRRIRIDVRRVNSYPIRREREITRSATGQEALLLRARLRVKHRYVAADPIGHKQPLARPVFHHA